MKKDLGNLFLRWWWKTISNRWYLMLREVIRARRHKELVIRNYLSHMDRRKDPPCLGRVKKRERQEGRGGPRLRAMALQGTGGEGKIERNGFNRLGPTK